MCHEWPIPIAIECGINAIQFCTSQCQPLGSVGTAVLTICKEMYEWMLFSNMLVTAVSIFRLLYCKLYVKNTHSIMKYASFVAISIKG